MAKSDTKTPLIRHENFIVAIGASAGGLEAIHEFFDNVPENTNLSFIIIQHLYAVTSLLDILTQSNRDTK